MGIAGFLGFGGSSDASTSGLVEIYPLSLQCSVFTKADIRATYLKILTDVAERMHGMKDEQKPALWDSCLQSEASSGLITLLAEAMLEKSDLFLVYAAGVLRRATDDEKKQIEADYKAKASSKVGVFVSFKNFRLTDMLTIYSDLEYCILASLYKTVNIAKAVQIKMSEMRSTVSLGDSAEVVKQAIAIADALRSGKDVLLDSKDDVTTATPEIGPTEKAIAFLDSKRAFYLGLPLAYISGLQTGGLGSTGEADARAVERGLRLYFVSILQPVVQAIFGVKVEFRSQDFRQVDSGLSVLKTFDLVGNEFLSKSSMQTIAARVFDVDPEKEALAIKAETAEAEKDLGASSGGGSGDIQKEALNGAQITSLVEVVTQVASGAIPRDAAVQIVMLSFQVDQPAAEKLLGTAGKGFTPTAAPKPSFGGGFAG